MISSDNHYNRKGRPEKHTQRENTIIFERSLSQGSKCCRRYSLNNNVHLLAVLILLQCLSLGISLNEKRNKSSWKTCEIFSAPSSLETGGWGVFAGRDFERYEVIEIVPRYVVMPTSHPLPWESAVKDFIFSYQRWNRKSGREEDLSAILLGNGPIYNHHPQANILYTGFSNLPKNADDTEILLGFTAKRRIKKGEELFVNYLSEDDGEFWFEHRNIEMKLLPTNQTKKAGSIYKNDKKKYCSKLYAGYGQPSWNRRTHNVQNKWFKFDTQRLPSIDHPSAVVTQDVSAGDVLEISPALIVGKDRISKTALAPLSFFWDDWDETGQKNLIDLRNNGHVKVSEKQYGFTDVIYVVKDKFKGFEDVVVVPIGGFLSLVDRVDNDDDGVNGMMRITGSGNSKGNAGIILELVALKDIKAGDRVRVGLPRSGASMSHAMDLLVEEFERTGQQFPEFLLRHNQQKSKSDEL